MAVELFSKENQSKAQTQVMTVNYSFRYGMITNKFLKDQSC